MHKRLQLSALVLFGDNFSFLNSSHHMQPQNTEQCNIKNQPSMGVILILTWNNSSNTFCT